MQASRQTAEALDSADPLAAIREQFELPPAVIYLDGNSLGPLTAASARAVEHSLRQAWGEQLIKSWNTAGWVDLPRQTGQRIAPLIGAGVDDVLVADSTSVNLYKLLAAALTLSPDRRTILTEAGNFPTDLYVSDAVSQRRPGVQVRRVEADGLLNALDASVAVVVLSHVNYRSGARHDMAEINARAHAVGAVVLWDLAHSAGAIPVDLAGSGADLAIGCGYKFLNGGPGAPAFLYVSPPLQDRLHNPIAGWFGHANPFAFEDHYRPAPGVDRWQVGTPPVLSLASLHAALEPWSAISMANVAQKSVQLFDLMAACFDGPLAGHGFDLITPRQAEARGSQISLRHRHAWPICQALIAEGVVGDFRTPDVLRFGLTPLYLRYVDVWDACERLSQIMATGRWRLPEFQAQHRVT